MKQLEEYINVGTKRMRCGYTTGTCAAAAARAAAELLLHGELVPVVTVSTPAGIDVIVEVEEHDFGNGWAQCAVQKDSGDDPDVTNGALVYARVEFCDKPGITIDGGVGVGRVTREGLDQPVGAAAINSTPRRMIAEQVENVLEEAPAFEKGLLVTISIPAGVELAAKTFNPRLGIEGGISVLGTGGIVRPMSEDALISSIELEMKTLRARGVVDLLVVPGNYGRDFACGQLELDMDQAVSCSNYFGATLDALIECGLADATMASLMERLADKLAHRSGTVQVEAIVFSNVHGVLGKTPGADELAEVFALS